MLLRRHGMTTMAEAASRFARRFASSGTPPMAEKALGAKTNDVVGTLKQMRAVLAAVDPHSNSTRGEAAENLAFHLEKVGSALDKHLADEAALSEAKFDAPTAISDEFFVDGRGNPVSNADYAFVKFGGPEGPLLCEDVRFGISFQGPDLVYMGHHHIAQEFYHMLDGPASWWTTRTPQWVRRDTSFHVSGEHHATATVGMPGETDENGVSTQDAPAEGAVFFWSWTGDMTLEILHSPKADGPQL